MDEKVLLREVANSVRGKLKIMLAIIIVIAIIISIATAFRTTTYDLKGTTATYLICFEDYLSFVLEEEYNPEDESQLLLQDLVLKYNTAILQGLKSDELYRMVSEESNLEVTKEAYDNMIHSSIDATGTILDIKVVHPQEEISEKVISALDNNLSGYMESLLGVRVENINIETNFNSLNDELTVEEEQGAISSFNFTQTELTNAERINIIVKQFIIIFPLLLILGIMVLVIKFLFQEVK